MHVLNTRMPRRALGWLMVFFITVTFACNTDDDAVVRPGEDVELDSGSPDTPIEDAGEDAGPPDADVPPAPSCDDGVQNGQESGVDCGGPDCQACELGESCEASSDCASGYCTGEVCVDESCATIECAPGKSCYRAVCYDACLSPDDCEAGTRCFEGACVVQDCDAVECAAEQTCYRGVCYGACSGGESCTEEGAECLDGSCVVPTCEDGLQNGDETDIDCGGPGCEACDPGKMCELNEDCQPPVELPWSECDFGEGTCTEVGTRERLVTRYVCGDAMTCESVEEVETESCTRETDGLECGETVIGEWGQCQGAGQQGVCSTEGERRRVITSFVCAEGGCDVVEEEEFEDCVLDTDAQACGTPETGEWSACGGFDDVCDQTGERSRTVTYFECGSGTCTERVDTEVESCSRVTTGESCGEETYGEWSACEGFNGVCGQTGTRSRTVSYRECASGSCSTRTTTESETCTRDTTGTACQADVLGSWSACSYADATCSTSGSRTRTITEYACQGGSCAQSFRTETDTAGCARTTDGTSCGTTTYGDWSSCGGFNGTCGNTGTRSRTATDRVCSDGGCTSVTRTETASCTRNTNGTSCGADDFTAWSSCGGFSGTCGESGSQSRTRTEYECSSGSCTSSNFTENRSCSRDTDGANCGSSTEGAWSSCGGFSGPCDTTGTQTRTVTDRRCANGSCSSVDRTESQTCTRSVSGNTCGDSTYTGWTSCGGFSSDCDTSGTQTRVRTDYRCSSGGSCNTSTTTESRSCSRSTNGDTCGAGVTYGSWGSCNYSSDCDNSATKTRTKYTRTCSGGSCQMTTSTDTGSCSRNTNGDSCGAGTTYGSWSSCSTVPYCEFSMRSRSVTTRTCSSGSCSSSTSTQSEVCYYRSPPPGQMCP